jgi:DNA polymerase-3 subunit gamma/tau
MSYQALARKYRPQRFSDIIGQETVVRTLQNAIEQKRIHHAYLFSGVRGIGKTTVARILAKALNCVSGPATEPDNTCTICKEITEGIDMDVREIDAATYTGVDSIRDLRDVTQFQPARDRYRIFIIDEAHMLSQGAWNALLKLIEEPPEHVIFMFATTEMQKVPATILSRVQKFTLRKITLEELVGRLRQIAKAEGIEADDAALEIVARRGEGSVRDALSILDQIIAFSGRSISSDDAGERRRPSRNRGGAAGSRRKRTRFQAALSRSAQFRSQHAVDLRRREARCRRSRGGRRQVFILRAAAHRKPADARR